MATYKEIDKNGIVIATHSDVADPVALTGVATSTSGAPGNSRLTVASVTGLFVGMPILCPAIPLGAFISGIVSSTVVELSLSKFVSGVWTTSVANAAASSAETGLLATAFGFSPHCIVTKAFPLGMWRNTLRGETGTSVAGTVGFTHPHAIIPTSPTTSTYFSSDEATTTWAAEKRHNGELWGFYPIVSSTGLLSYIPANPSNRFIQTA